MRAFIWDKMGTGKTKRSLDLTASSGRFLVVICPARVVDTWINEVSKWTERKAYAYRGSMRERMLQASLDHDGGILVMSYEMTRNFKVTKIPKGFSLIIDESHFVKNPRSHRSQAVRLFSDRAEDVLMLTGTPTRKDLEDIYGQCAVLYPKKADRINHFGDQLGSLTAFRKAYGTPTVLWINGVARTKWAYADNMAATVAKAVSDDVLPVRLSDISRPHEQWIEAPKSVEELAAFRKWNRTRELTDTVYAASASAAAGKLAQLDDGFAYDVDGNPYRFGDSKMRAVIDADLPHPLLVWCRYKASATAFLTRSDAMIATRYIEPDVDRSGIRFVVGNFMSMGTGVDGLQKLMSAQVFVDLPYTSADYEQAISRLVRRGQKNTPSLYVVDTEVNQRIMRVIEGRLKLDEITREPLKADD